MTDLTNFAKRVLEQLARVNREPHWEQGEAQRYTAEMGVRRDRFEQTAMRLISTVIQPRLEILASHFSNSSPTREEPTGHYSCWFGYSERLPTSTKVAFAVEHDVQFEKVAVCYETVMGRQKGETNGDRSILLAREDKRGRVHFIALLVGLGCGEWIPSRVFARFG